MIIMVLALPYVDEEEVGGVINVGTERIHEILWWKRLLFQLKTFDVEIIVVLFA